MAGEPMTSGAQERPTRSALGEQAEILRIVRTIRDELQLIPNRVVDEVADHLKEMDLGIGERARGHARDVVLPADGHPDGPSAPVVSSMVATSDEAVDAPSGAVPEDEKEGVALQELSESLQLKKDEFQRLDLQKAALVEEVSALERAQKDTHDQLADLEAKRRGLLDKVGEWRSMSEQADAIRLLETERDAALAKATEALVRCEELRSRYMVAQALLERLWPAWLETENMVEWKAEIERGVADRASSPAVGLLFAALHTCSAARHDGDPKTLHDSLRDVGRRLYAWLRDTERTDDEAASIAEKWAHAINSECEGRGEVEVPIPGHAANNQWMIFQPRGGSSPDVLSVRSWCVRDAQKRPIHRAEVTV